MHNFNGKPFMGVKYVLICWYLKLTEPASTVLLSSLLKKVDHVVKFTMIEGMGMIQDAGPFLSSI